MIAATLECFLAHWAPSLHPNLSGAGCEKYPYCQAYNKGILFGLKSLAGVSV